MPVLDGLERTEEPEFDQAPPIVARWRPTV
jgi:hypothetical protein